MIVTCSVAGGYSVDNDVCERRYTVFDDSETLFRVSIDSVGVDK